MTPGAWLKHMLSWPERRVLEPLEGYWQGNPSFGQQWAVPTPMTPGIGGDGVVVPIARMDRTPGPPRPWTVRLNRYGALEQALAAAPGTLAFLRARITVGNGGYNNTFLVDWAHGTQFTVVGSTITVDAVQEGLMRPDIVTPGNLSAAFGHGTAAPGNATFTLFPAVPGVGASLIVAEPIPQYATRVELYATVPGATFAPNRDPANLLVQRGDFLLNTGTLISSQFNDPELRSGGVALHPEARRLTIVSGAAATIIGYATLVFRLAL